MNLVKAWAIFLVVCVHCNEGGVVHFMANWISPPFYYMALFVFVSGYFYKKRNDEQSVFAYIKSKFTTLVLPYFVWNLIYGVINTAFRYAGVIEYGDAISLHSLFIRPWIDGHQFHFNIAAWFLLSLFLVSVATFLVRKILSCMHILNDWLLLAVFFAVSVLCIYLSEQGYNQGWGLCFLRAGFLLPYFQMGFVYKKIEFFLSKHKVICMTFLTVALYGILVSAVGENLWINCVFMRTEGAPLKITAITVICILLVLSVCEILVPAFENNRIVRYVGDNTFTIMLHHPFFLFLLNFALFILASLAHLSSFDAELFHSTLWYCYLWRDGRIALAYVVFVMAMPLLVKYFTDKLLLSKYNQNNMQLKRKEDSETAAKGNSV